MQAGDKTVNGVEIFVEHKSTLGSSIELRNVSQLLLLETVREVRTAQGTSCGMVDEADP